MKRLVILKIILLTLTMVNFSVCGWAKTVTLSWDASPSTVSGYKVYYDAGSSTPLEGTGAAEGESPLDAGNVLTYVIHGLPDGVDHYFAVTAYDSSGNESTYSNTVHSPVVTNTNNPPVLASIGNKSVLEGANVNFVLSATDSDNDTLTYSTSSLPTDAGFNNSTGQFTWTPAMNQSGSHSVTFTVSDGSASDTETIIITVGDVNQPPVLSSIGNKAINEGSQLTFAVSGSDPDNNTLTYSSSSLPTGASFNSSGQFSWTPEMDQSESYSVTFTVSDGSASDTETIIITVGDVNQPPVLSSIGNKAINEGSQLTFAVSGSDPDNNTLTYSSSSLPTGASFNSSGQFSWTPEMDQSESYSVTFTVSDGSASDSETIVINVGDVNQPPVLDLIGTKTIGEGSKLTFTILGTDPDDDALSYSAEGLPTDATFDAVTRSFSWTPEFQATENTRIARVTFEISDGPASDSEVVTINVTNVNRAPVMEAIGSQSLTEGDSYNLIINATDPDSNSIFYDATNLPSGSVFTPSTRSFSWMPDNNQAGTYSVTFIVSDGTVSDSELVIFTVNNGNEAPVLDVIGGQTIAENSQLAFVVSASDINGDNLTYSASGLPTGAVFDVEQQRFSWTPDYSQSGDFTAHITVTDGTFEDTEIVEITVTNSNRSPIIGGAPSGSVMASTNFDFTPVASDPDGDPLIFSVTNKPDWADFNVTTGKLSGTPTESQVGVSSAIVISVSDNIDSASLSSFSIEVVAYVHQDSDGDGVLDHLDAFPNDNSEWEDTDGDLIGNNSDDDDDNDGIGDARDGSPLDETQSGWIITATVNSGGYLTPEGEISVLYGGSQRYQLTPMAGYYINDLLVDNVSVGLVTDYEFENVGSHHTIAAIFIPIPTGLSCDPIAPGLVGIDRIDGGDDSTNLVDNKPKQNLDYRFRVLLRDSVAIDQRRVFLILDEYKYEMQSSGGVLTEGINYTFNTRLGASFLHQFFYSVEDLSGNQVWRYPQSGDLPGPTVELLNGKNVLGIAANINAYALNANETFNDKGVYRWNPDSGPKGSFKLADSGAPIASGEGYVLKRSSEVTLPDLSIYSEISSSSYEIQIKSGWNLISNPYSGNVALADIEVRLGEEPPLLWLDAATNNLLVDAVYSYLGKDWGNSNEFASAAGTEPATLIPWIGYWIYVNPTDQDVSLIIPKPLR